MTSNTLFLKHEFL